MIRSKELFIEQQIEDYNADVIYMEADLWEQEQRILASLKPERIGIRVFSRKFRFRNRINKLHSQRNTSDFLPF